MRTIWSSAAALSVALLGAVPAHAADIPPAIEITPAGTQPTAQGPAASFVGTVSVDPLLAPHLPTSRVSMAAVSFPPGARSAWHTHPPGQILVVTAGLGWVQEEGGPVRELRPGDVMWIPPGGSTGTEPPPPTA